MRRALSLMAVICFTLLQRNQAQLPAGFSWVNLESNAPVMAKVRNAFGGESITAIREVGVEGDFALVVTASRQGGVVPAGDEWRVYSISLQSGRKQLLVRGYRLEMLEWLGAGNRELAITYDSCYGCEPEMMFTTLHLDGRLGWAARWKVEGLTDSSPQPGVGVVADLVADPDDFEDVTQVFGLIVEQSGGFAAGSWVRTRNLKTGKVTDQVERFTVDPATEGNRVEHLVGDAAVRWERALCKPSKPSQYLSAPSLGQDSAACHEVVGADGGR
jgi:hypothetical protein